MDKTKTLLEGGRLSLQVPIPFIFHFFFFFRFCTSCIMLVFKCWFIWSFGSGLFKRGLQQNKTKMYAFQRIHLCGEVQHQWPFRMRLWNISMEKHDLMCCCRIWQKCESYAWTSIQVYVKYDLDNYSTRHRRVVGGQCSTIKWAQLLAWFKKKTDRIS